MRHQDRLRTRRASGVQHSLPVALAGAAVWLAHFGAATRKTDGSRFGQMSPVFEQLFAYGQELSLLALGAGTVCLFWFGNRQIIFRRKSMVGPILLINLIVAVKLFIYGNIVFSIQSMVILFCSTVLFCSRKMHSPGGEDETFAFGVSAISISGALIVITNLLALVQHPSAVLNDINRFHGTTVSGQHLAMMITISSACFWYRLVSSQRHPLLRLFDLFILVGGFYLVFLTGSRTGLGAFFLVSLVFFAFKRPLVQAFSSIFIVGILSVALFGREFQFAFESIFDTFFTGRADTRTHHWLDRLNEGWQYYLTGAPPSEETGRLEFVESYWVAVFTSIGIIGPVLAILAVRRIVARVFLIFRMRPNLEIPSARMRLIVASLASIVFVSTFEASMLGVTAAHTFMAYLALSISEKLPNPQVRNQKVHTRFKTRSVG